jgi:2-polyprenyl-3-methyl-5-hydroxy-6-metoxy-1,4-benzoquinol methylase
MSAGIRGTISSREMTLNEFDNSFLSGGYARLSHFNSPLWKSVFRELESTSDAFKNLVWANGPEGYAWPLDPLHSWSRAWEYPFVATHLSKRRHAAVAGDHPVSDNLPKLKILDVGAAVTFFSAYLAQQGIDLTNFDYDESMIPRFERVFARIRNQMKLSDVPRYVAGDARDTKLPGQSFDGILCISVLEHIPHWERALTEFVRLLRPGGFLILTFDVQLTGKPDGLNAADTTRLLNYLDGQMRQITVQNDIPKDVLHMYNSPYPAFRSPGILGIKRLLRPLKHAIKPADNLCVYGGVWELEA